MATSFDPAHLTPEVHLFLTERHLGTLSTHTADGHLQVTPVGVTFDEARSMARVITWATSYKARNVAAQPGREVAVCQVDRGRWLTIYGTATVTDDPEAVAEAVRRYADRYRQPKVRDDRVVIEIQVTRLIGRP